MARLETEDREMAYRFYVTDALYAGGQNQCMSKRFIDMIFPQKEVDGDAVAEDVIKNAGLVCKE